MGEGKDAIGGRENKGVTGADDNKKGVGAGEGKDVVVVGGGAIGLCAAYYLVRDGHRVTVFDAEYAGGSSDGNAGMIVPSHVVPLAAPGVMAKGLRWLLNPESPFYIKPRADVALLRWLWQFRMHCTANHVERSVPILRELSLASVDLFDEVTTAVGAETGYANTGLLMLYDSEYGRKDAHGAADLAEAAGLELARLDRDAVRKLDPYIRAPYEGAVLYRQDGRVDPDALLSALGAYLEKSGVAIRRGVSVNALDRQHRTGVGVRTTDGVHRADEVVVAAGAWSGPMARTLGLRLPLEPAKGYSVTVPFGPQPPQIPHILTEEKLAVTPILGRLRFAGTLALSGFDDSIDVRRVKPLLRLAGSYGLDASGASPNVWYGYRPCSPDGLPFIERTFNNLTVATGHGMMGITLAPITGRLVADLIGGITPSVDPEPFRLDRFA